MVTKVLEIKSVGILFVVDIRHKVIKFVSHIQIFRQLSLSLVRDEQPPWDKMNMKNDTEGPICSFSTLDEASGTLYDKSKLF